MVKLWRIRNDKASQLKSESDWKALRKEVKMKNSEFPRYDSLSLWHIKVSWSGILYPSLKKSFDQISGYSDLSHNSCVVIKLTSFLENERNFYVCNKKVWLIHLRFNSSCFAILNVHSLLAISVTCMVLSYYVVWFTPFLFFEIFVSCSILGSCHNCSQVHFSSYIQVYINPFWW